MTGNILVTVPLTRDVYGPFDTWAEAVTWGTKNLDHDGWALTLLSDPAKGPVRNNDGSVRKS